MNSEKIYKISVEKVYENLDIRDKQQNFNEYFLYYKCFIVYFIEKYNLDKYDELINNSELNFTPIKEEDMDIYQYFSSPYLKYLYLRNSLHLERLTSDERLFLQYRIENNNYNLDYEMKIFIERTYKKLIFEDVLKNGQRCLIAFGPDNKELFAHNDSIVLGIRYDKYDLDSSDINKALELDRNRQQYITSIIQNIESQFNDIEVLQYGKFNIKKYR